MATMDKTIEKELENIVESSKQIHGLMRAFVSYDDVTKIELPNAEIFSGKSGLTIKYKSGKGSYEITFKKR